jgi:ribonuclease D
MCGVDPNPLTLRELVQMAEARETVRWNHTASLMALVANCNIDTKKTKPFEPADFHPDTQRKAAVKRVQSSNEAAAEIILRETTKTN